MDPTEVKLVMPDFLALAPLSYFGDFRNFDEFKKADSSFIKLTEDYYLKYAILFKRNLLKTKSIKNQLNKNLSINGIVTGIQEGCLLKISVMKIDDNEENELHLYSSSDDDHTNLKKELSIPLTPDQTNSQQFIFELENLIFLSKTDVKNFNLIFEVTHNENVLCTVVLMDDVQLALVHSLKCQVKKNEKILDFCIPEKSDVEIRIFNLNNRDVSSLELHVNNEWKMINSGNAVDKIEMNKASDNGYFVNGLKLYKENGKLDVPELVFKINLVDPSNPETSENAEWTIKVFNEDLENIRTTQRKDQVTIDPTLKTRASLNHHRQHQQKTMNPPITYKSSQEDLPNQQVQDQVFLFTNGNYHNYRKQKGGCKTIETIGKAINLGLDLINNALDRAYNKHLNQPPTYTTSPLHTHRQIDYNNDTNPNSSSLKNNENRSSTLPYPNSDGVGASGYYPMPQPSVHTNNHLDLLTGTSYHQQQFANSHFQLASFNRSDNLTNYHNNQQYDYNRPNYSRQNGYNRQNEYNRPEDNNRQNDYNRQDGHNQLQDNNFPNKRKKQKRNKQGKENKNPNSNSPNIQNDRNTNESINTIKTPDNNNGQNSNSNFIRGSHMEILANTVSSKLFEQIKAENEKQNITKNQNTISQTTNSARQEHTVNNKQYQPIKPNGFVKPGGRTSDPETYLNKPNKSTHVQNIQSQRIKQNEIIKPIDTPVHLPVKPDNNTNTLHPSQINIGAKPGGVSTVNRNQSQLFNSKSLTFAPNNNWQNTPNQNQKRQHSLIELNSKAANQTQNQSNNPISVTSPSNTILQNKTNKIPNRRYSLNELIFKAANQTQNQLNNPKTVTSPSNINGQGRNSMINSNFKAQDQTKSVTSPSNTILQNKTNQIPNRQHLLNELTSTAANQSQHPLHNSKNVTFASTLKPQPLNLQSNFNTLNSGKQLNTPNRPHSLCDINRIPKPEVNIKKRSFSHTETKSILHKQAPLSTQFPAQQPNVNKTFGSTINLNLVNNGTTNSKKRRASSDPVPINAQMKNQPFKKIKNFGTPVSKVGSQSLHNQPKTNHRPQKNHTVRKPRSNTNVKKPKPNKKGAKK